GRVAEVLPGRDEAAVGQGDDCGLGLGVPGGGVDQELAARLAAVRIEDLAVDRPAPAVESALADILPGRDEAAVGKRRYRRMILGAERGRIDEEFTSELRRP